MEYDVAYSAAEGERAWAEATATSGYQDDTTTISDEQPEEAVEGATEVAEAKDTEQQDKGATDSDDADDEFEDAVDVAEAGTEADVTLAALGSHRPEIGGKVASASQSTGKHTGSGGASKRQQQEERRKQMSELQERIVELEKALDSPNVTDTDKQNIEAELSALKTELGNLGGVSIGLDGWLFADFH
uniref:hypothetical protein n=1 Tax=Anaplasma marginale TaxID=770 RepID=UPI00040A5DD6|nr:hypothetical protein [Anaplasma marginale]